MGHPVISSRVQLVHCGVLLSKAVIILGGRNVHAQYKKTINFLPLIFNFSLVLLLKMFCSRCEKLPLFVSDQGYD